jgi:hypothetical protein
MNASTAPNMRIIVEPTWKTWKKTIHQKRARHQIFPARLP